MLPNGALILTKGASKSFADFKGSRRGAIVSFNWVFSKCLFVGIYVIHLLFYILLIFVDYILLIFVFNNSLFSYLVSCSALSFGTAPLFDGTGVKIHCGRLCGKSIQYIYEFFYTVKCVMYCEL